MPIKAEADQDQNSHYAERYPHHAAQLARGSLRPGRGGQTPLAEEIPDSRAEVEGRGQNADYKERQKQGILHALINGVEIRQPVRFKPLCVEMPTDKNES